MKLTVNVTQDHIDRGNMVSCYDCPIALAILDAVKVMPDTDRTVNLWPICVDGLAAHLGMHYDAALPNAAVVFISHFDQGIEFNPVHPFSFTLDFPNLREQ